MLNTLRLIIVESYGAVLLNTDCSLSPTAPTVTVPSLRVSLSAFFLFFYLPNPLHLRYALYSFRRVSSHASSLHLASTCSPRTYILTSQH